MIKKILIIVLLIAVGVGLYAYYQFNKPHTDIASAKPVASLSAEDLFSQFETDEVRANTSYIGKIIEVTGVVSTVEKGGKGDVNVLMLVEGQMFGVALNFDKGKADPGDFKEGTTLTIKGECAGMLSDVVLIRCVIVKSN
jgi:hypothetical protein